MTDEGQAAVRDHIFISYRRDDARGASGRIYDWLRIGFGRERVFRDVASIGVGKWRDKIDAALARSAVCVVVIGPRWANADNLPRLHDSADMVRHELLTALGSDAITVVPTLVEGLKVMDVPTKQLPSELQPLFDVWNAREVTEEGWEDDTRRLIAEIAEATGLDVGPDLDALLHDAAGAQQHVAELEQTRPLQADQIDALRRTVDELRRKLAEAPATERSGLAAAFAALAQGDSRAAEQAFEDEYEVQSRAAEAAHRTMAEAARNVANLALTHDTTKAVSFYRKALALESEDAEASRLLGYALIVLGNVARAEAAFSESLRIARAHGDSWSEMAAQIGLGDILRTSKNLQAAAVAYAAAMRLTEQQLATDPSNTQWQRDLSVSHDRIGDVLVAQGDGPGALAAYRKGLAIREALAARDPANTQWQRDLAVSHNRIGEVLVAQGDGPGALAAYRKCLAIAEALTARDPANTQWQRDLAVSHNKIGEVLVAQGDGPGALAAYRNGLAIREALAARDPANTQWQRDLAVSHDRVGDVLVAQGDGPGALAAYRKCLAIAGALAASDPGNTEWQRDLSVSHEKIGNVLVAQGDGPGALAAYRKGLAIHEALAARDLANSQWQRDLSVSHEKIGDVLVAQGDGPGALAAYRKGLAIREVLTARDPANAQWQTDLAVSCAKLGALEYGQSVEVRRAYLMRGRASLLKLKSEGRLLPSQDWTEWFEGQLSQLPAGSP
jgi:predicted negative regulator of RcsB-dependent stress response